MNPEELKRLLAKHQLGQCTPEEEAWLDTWLHSLADDEKEPSDDETTLRRIKGQLRQRITQAIREGEATPAFDEAANKFSFRKVAASIVLFIGLGLTAFLVLKNTPVFSPTLAYVEFFNPAGQQKVLILSDGSKVYLNAQTTFRYPKEFAGDTRPVYLEGEAFFEVAPNAAKPFIIQTGKLKTRVVGTSFNVKAYRQDGEIEVAVLTGKVSVSDSLSSVVLVPNQKVRYALASKQLTRMDIPDAEEYKAWIEGTLVFEDALLPEMIQVLNRRYNVSITLGTEKLKNCALNARFKNESLEKVLDELCKYVESSYQRKGNQIVIHGRGC